MQQKNVVELFAAGNWAAVNERRMIVREHLLAETIKDANSQAVAALILTIDVNGQIQTRAVNIEPEHVGPVCDALSKAKTKLRTLAARAPDKHPMADLIELPHPK